MMSDVFKVQGFTAPLIIHHSLLRYFTVFSIFLLTAASSFGQSLDDVKKFLAQRDLNKIEKYLENPNDRTSGKKIHVWEYLRELNADYEEGVCYFEIVVPDTENVAINIVYTYRITLIANKKNIIFYELSEKKYKEDTEDMIPYFETISKFRDDKAFGNLKILFTRTFLKELNEAELFNEDIVYGHHCGIAGIDPDEKLEIDRLVQKKNRKSLLNWLQSTNTEKQVYAVDGFYQLKTSGVKLTDKEINLINQILKKKGTIQVCYGCISTNEEISTVTKGFMFE